MLCSPRIDTGTHTHTHRPTDTKVNTEDTLSGFQEFFPSTYHQGSVQLLGKSRKQAYRRAAAETVARKSIEHLYTR